MGTNNNTMGIKSIWSMLLLILALISADKAFAQLVLDGAYINISGGTSTTSVTVVVGESSTTGITRLGTGGHIYTEGQYNAVYWSFGTATGSYVFPFGHSNTDYLPFTFNKTSATSSSVSASTWNTDQQNMPHPGPSNVAKVHLMTGIGDSISTAIDRFWDIRSTAAVTADLTFSYRGLENSLTVNPAGSLKAQHWNGALCTGWDPSVGPGNTGVTTGIGTVGPITGQTTFSPWVLTRTAAPLSNAPIANAGPDKVIHFGGNAQIGGTPAAIGGKAPYTYAWSPATALSSPTVANPTASPLSTTVYTIIVTDAYGCSSSDPVTVTVSPVLAYATPKKKLDGGFYPTQEGVLYFKYQEEYLDGTLKFSIYNANRDVMASNTVNAPVINSQVKKFGDDRYAVNCFCITSLPIGYYILEIINEKNEIVKLRFYYDGFVPSPSPC